MKRRSRRRRARGGGFPVRRLAPAVAAAVAALALFAQTDRALDRLGASKRLRIVTAMSREMEETGRAPSSLVARNLRVLREAARLDPSEVGVPVALGGQYMLLHRYDSAVEVYREALAMEPRPETYLNLGNALWVSGRSDEARQTYATAVRLAPRIRPLVPPEARP